MGKEGDTHTLIANKLNTNDPAVVFLKEELVDNETIAQISNMIESSNSIQHARIMPDCHVGQGCCIGFTCIICHDKVVPSYVGGDIGCGILTYPLRKTKLNLVKIEKTIKSIIPMGNGHTNVHSEPPIEESYISRYLEKAQIQADQFASEKGLSSRTLDYSYFTSLCEKIQINVEVCLRSFGTLGGGNHFIEINLDEASGEHYLTIHSGSRSFGQKLFEHYNSLMPKRTAKQQQQQQRPSAASNTSSNDSASDNNSSSSSSGGDDSGNGSGSHLSPTDSIDYCFDMIVAQQLAIMNRHIMLQLILRQIGIEYIEGEKIESIHNYIDFSRMILRKGAISAEADELCIVALNMKDGILICKGKGNPDWNYSCAQGCGRFFSRNSARRNIKFKDYQRIMSDVVSTSVCVNTIDESPQAYKNKELIIEMVEPTVEVLSQYISVCSMKGID